MTTFNSAQSTARMLEGMNAAAGSRAEALTVARGVAQDLGRRQRRITMDDVAQEMELRHVSSDSLQNAAGSVFRDSSLWVFTGDWVRSVRVSRHRNALRVWEYVGRD